MTAEGSILLQVLKKLKEVYLFTYTMVKLLIWMCEIDHIHYDLLFSLYHFDEDSCEAGDDGSHDLLVGDAVCQEGCVGEIVSDGVARLCLLLMLSPTENFHMQTTPKNDKIRRQIWQVLHQYCLFL